MRKTFDACYFYFSKVRYAGRSRYAHPVIQSGSR